MGSLLTESFRRYRSHGAGKWIITAAVLALLILALLLHNSPTSSFPEIYHKLNGAKSAEHESSTVESMAHEPISATPTTTFPTVTTSVQDKPSNDPKPKDRKLVGLVPFGRRSRVAILDCYLRVHYLQLRPFQLL